MGGPSKPSLHPCQHVKRGYPRVFTPLTRPLIMVNTRLPKGILTAGNGIGRTPIRALCRSRGAAPGWAQVWATTIEHGIAFSRQACPRLGFRCPSKGGSRECRMRAAPAISCATAQKKAHTSIQGSRGNPTFPAQWLYGYIALTPGIGRSCPRRLPETGTPARSGFRTSERLDADH